MTDTDELKEIPVTDFPGWTKLQMGASRRYRSPGGLEISAARFMQLATKYKGQSFIPESIIPPPSKRQEPSFFVDTSSKTRAPIAPFPVPTKYEKGPDQPVELKDIASDTKPRAAAKSKSKHPRPSAVTLAIGFKKLALLITTVIIARLMQDERAGMTEQEATILGNALGNLLESTQWNENFGWIIAETGDWQALGYVLMMYASRLGDIVKEKNDAASRSGETVSPIYNGANRSGAGNNGTSVRRGASLPYSQTGPRWFTETP